MKYLSSFNREQFQVSLCLLSYTGSSGITGHRTGSSSFWGHRTCPLLAMWLLSLFLQIQCRSQLDLIFYYHFLYTRMCSIMWINFLFLNPHKVGNALTYVLQKRNSFGEDNHFPKLTYKLCKEILPWGIWVSQSVE